jgi:hypothetical protein
MIDRQNRFFKRTLLASQPKIYLFGVSMKKAGATAGNDPNNAEDGQTVQKLWSLG